MRTEYQRLVSHRAALDLNDVSTCGSKRVINPGSVGLQSSARGACWALFGPDVELMETSYDAEAAADRIRRTGVPMAEEFAQHVLNPPMEGP
ncbi:MAG: metallophosphatase family protein [Alicyclobacillus herbarius]|uniref:hypothetical protein n=1 Tax=Alicyclobacillus herbarius TaxID=122960 RepID=UPI0023530919|nr:hypothetical protein [Alicyclobacillus herbarius]MCL6633234.1 metallophosphatase family protein [Alicyclobacillus herbarius]